MKKAITLILALILTLSVMTPAMATEGYTPQHTDAADTLYELGLFAGTGTDADGKPTYELDRTATRLEGIIMLLRLLGEIDDAKAYEGTSPFTDVPDWAKKYVDYAYYKKYTSGVSATEFGSDNELLGKAYLTFVLRALGYSDKGGADFTYNDALTKAAEVGLIAEGECEGAIYRDDCANTSLIALATPLKDSETTLAEKLIDAGVLDEEAVEDSGILGEKEEEPEKETVRVPISNGKMKYSDLQAAFPEAALFNCGGYSRDIQDADAVHDFSEINLYLGARVIMEYWTGETDSIKIQHYNRTETPAYPGAYVITTIFTKDAHMIGYAVMPDDFSGDYVEFTVCDFYDMDTVESYRKQVKELVKKEITKQDVLYIESVEVTHEDGTTTVEQYLRINKSKSNIPLDKAVYFSTQNTDALEDNRIGGLFTPELFGYYTVKDKSNGKTKISEPFPYEITGDAWLLYDENYEIIAWIRGGKVGFDFGDAMTDVNIDYGTVTIPVYKGAAQYEANADFYFMAEDILEALPNATCINKGCLTWYLSDGSGEIDYTPRTYSRKEVFMQDYFIGRLASGKSNTLAITPSPFAESYGIYERGHNFITILDSKSHMIGYAVVPPKFSGDSIELILCDYFNGTEIMRQRSK